MSYFIPFGIGLAIGIWIATYAWNKHYHSEIWNGNKQVMLESLKAQEAAYRRKTEEHELAISEMLDRRMNGKPPIDPSTQTRRRK